MGGAVSAYTLTPAGLILLGGSLGDRYGRRRVFMIGVCRFALASALCGLTPNAGVLMRRSPWSSGGRNCRRFMPRRYGNRGSVPAKAGIGRNVPGRWTAA